MRNPHIYVTIIIIILYFAKLLTLIFWISELQFQMIEIDRTHTMSSGTEEEFCR